MKTQMNSGPQRSQSRNSCWLFLGTNTCPNLAPTIRKSRLFNITQLWPKETIPVTESTMNLKSTSVPIPQVYKNINARARTSTTNSNPLVSYSITARQSNNHPIYLVLESCMMTKEIINCHYSHHKQGEISGHHSDQWTGNAMETSINGKR